ncbi:hypothetical protein [Brevibacillus daliensis]|uniref:hypothetical protein n=1 Tax=Brevibacillus daliensis TaxID=2892995 RepID=UPI001E42B5B5|nr:hypothetical protein [Brevibacillus daliensis]
MIVYGRWKNQLVRESDTNIYLIFIIQLEEIILSLHNKDTIRARNSLREAKDMLLSFPGLREKGLLSLLEAFYLALMNQKEEALSTWEMGVTT